MCRRASKPNHAPAAAAPAATTTAAAAAVTAAVYYVTAAAILQGVATQTIGAENTSLAREPVMEFPYFIAGTAFPCSSLEKCTFVINGSDTIGQTIDESAEEEIEKSPPCVIQGHLDINHNWYGYLATLRLHPETGKFYYKFTYAQRKCCIKILLYLSEQVDKLKFHMSCIQKQSILDPQSPQVISLSPSSPASGCVHNNTLASIECTSGRILRSDIEREWYIAAASCGSPKGLDMHYSLIVYGLIGECPQQLTVSQASPASPPPSIFVTFIIIMVSSLQFLNLSL